MKINLNDTEVVNVALVRENDIVKVDDEQLRVDEVSFRSGIYVLYCTEVETDEYGSIIRFNDIGRVVLTDEDDVEVYCEVEDEEMCF